LQPYTRRGEASDIAWRHLAHEVLARGLSVGGAIACAVFSTVCAFLLFWGPPALRGWTDAPTGTDAVPYTSMAIQLARGNGLAEDPSDPLMSQWFVMPAMSRGEPVPSTRWPPLFPLMMSGVFKVVGFNLDAVRATNCLLMALTCGLVAGVLGKRHGLGVAAVFFVLFALIDERVRASARVIMTEPLAALLVTAGALVLIRMADRMALRHIIGAGVLFGAAILTRTIVIFWLPGLALLLIWLSRRHHSSWRRSITSAGLMTSAALLVCAPWFLHNIRTLNAFMPLGSHVYTLPSGWSDGAWHRGGVWASLGPAYFEHVIAPADPETVRARKQAEYGRAQAVEWIVSHPIKASALAAQKAFRFWASPLSVAQMSLVFPLLGLLWLRSREEAAVILGLQVVATLAIALTWIWEVDRMQVPTLPLLHYAGAIGIVRAIAALARRGAASAEYDTSLPGIPAPSRSGAR
jgi:4-amino-4-deoxy-L-arabinose transferase-like glycosyltransferase